MRRLFVAATGLYIAIYAFESPVRYVLHLAGMDAAIFLRGGLLAGPLVLLLARQFTRGNIHPAFWVFGLILAVHGSISLLNFHSIVAPMYGANFLMPILFGFVISSELMVPSRKLLWLLGTLWAVSVVALFLDKYAVTFPWTGMETTLGGLKVDISRGWDITDGADKRVAGFARSSIDAAALLPMLAFIVIQRCRVMLRAMILAVTFAAVFLTTQKGAVVAFGIIAAILLLPRRTWFALLCTSCLAFTALAVLLPLLTSGLLMPTNGGVFSMASFAMRVTDTWPDAWQWIRGHDIFPFATGLGGLSGAMRFFAADSYNPADNLFVFLYGNFGVPALVYLAWANRQALAVPAESRPVAVAAVAILAFILAYGSVLGMVEGPVAAMFAGAAVGTLWHLRQAAANRKWAEPYTPRWFYALAAPAPRQLEAR